MPGLFAFLPLLAVGFLTAAAVGWLAIKWLMAYLNKHSLYIFAGYCVAVGLIVLVIQMVIKSNSSMQDPGLHSTRTILHFVIYFFLVTVVACVPVTPVVTPGSFHIQYSFAAQPWLGKVSNCAGVNIVTTELRATDFQSPQVADMVIRLGQSDNLPSYTFQIGTDNLLIIANAQNPVQTLTAEQVRGLFTGGSRTGNPSAVATPKFRFGYSPQERTCNSFLSEPSCTVVL